MDDTRKPNILIRTKSVLTVSKLYIKYIHINFVIASKQNASAGTFNFYKSIFKILNIEICLISFLN